ncbi:MAG TPA: hypothetical protein VHX37_15580 [Acidobacteriaceae bacterium]|jgi:hypothetical protein|nr:hypothetical protein [Acidobacteriaceae bacterium]
MTLIARPLVAWTTVLGFPGLPWLNRMQHGSVSRPLVSLLVLILIPGMAGRAFRRKTN